MKKGKPQRNDACPCGATKADGRPVKYKNCCELKNTRYEVPQEVIDYFTNHMSTPEPFEKGGFLTGRRFISETFKGDRMRAVGNRVYRRPADETFHLFLFRTFSEELTQKWVEQQEAAEKPHQIIKWFREAQALLSATDAPRDEKVRSVTMSGNIRALLSLAYDFYTLRHCGAYVPPRLLNRLRDTDNFQGARYEIAVAALACRSGFEITWVNSDGKHCEFIGTHKVTGDRAAFEVKSHHRSGVLGREGTFNSESSRVKIMDHVREAVEQAPEEDVPLIIFDDLNLPLTPGKLDEKKWFEQVESQLEHYGFFSSEDYKRCGALLITNFSWHFHDDIPPNENEVLMHFHTGNKYSLKQETLMKYLLLAAKQYGFVPMLQHEFPNVELPPTKF